MSMEKLIAMTDKYGKTPSFVIAGGGNTSLKEGGTLYIKKSGASLTDITEEGFTSLFRDKLDVSLIKSYSEDAAGAEKEAFSEVMSAKTKWDDGKIPSVETFVHEVLPGKFVLHVHPTAVNALTCSKNGKAEAAEMFPDSIWVDECIPGYALSMKVKKALEGKHAHAQCVFVENHGVFFTADSTEEIDVTVGELMNKLDAKIKKGPDFSECEFDQTAAAKIAPVLRMTYDKNGKAFAVFTANREVMSLAKSRENFLKVSAPTTPDHVMYCGKAALFLECADIETVKEAFAKFEEENGNLPKIVFVKDVGMFALGSTYEKAKNAAEVFLDNIAITEEAENFGGIRPLSSSIADYIDKKIPVISCEKKPLAGKIAVITGSAQGFGEGIARYLAAEGAAVVIADMNYAGAQSTAEAIKKDTGAPAVAVAANVSDEESVRLMIEKAVLSFGGLDVFVNNAGIVRAGSLEEMTKQNFELVTSVNYTAYFLCAKYASAVMKIQRAVSPEYMSDIIEINSKSGLSGSNKNFAYAGSKFGGIGLTESFALELAPFGIKVNAVCPGNFLDGPLWSDPVKGLFVQYLNAGKVPGAKTTDDVRKFYEAKVPLGRGCRIEDVAKAVKYIIGQAYETGQAVPVTGGQEMLK